MLINIEDLLSWNLSLNELDAIHPSLGELKLKPKEIKKTSLPRILMEKNCGDSYVRYNLIFNSSFDQKIDSVWLPSKRPIFFKFEKIDENSFCLFEHEDGNIILRNGIKYICFSYEQSQKNKDLFEKHYILNPFLIDDSNKLYFVEISKFVQNIKSKIQENKK